MHSPSKQDTATDLVADIYEAAHRTERWPDVLERIALQAGSRNLLLVQMDLHRQRVCFSRGAGITAQALQHYTAHFARDDPFVQQCAQQAPHGTAVSDRGLFPSRKALECAYGPGLSRHMTEMGAAHWGGAILCHEPGCLAFVRLARGAHDGPWRPGQLEVITALAPHLRGALHLHREIVTLRQERMALSRTLDRLSPGLCLLARDATVLHSNTRFEAIIARRPALGVASGKLAAADPEQTRELLALIDAAATGHGEEPFTAAPFIARDPARGHALPMLVAPLCVAAATDRDDPERAGSVIILSDPDEHCALSPQVLKLAYGLTCMEACIAMGVANGDPMPTIARRYEVELSTVRTHLRAVYRKTGVVRQAALVKLILGGPFTLGAEPLAA